MVISSNKAERERECKVVSKEMWQVHTCQIDIFNNDHRQASSRVISDIIKQIFFYAESIYTLKDIISDVKNDHVINLSYQQAYWAMEAALESILGVLRESYNLLLKYCHVLKDKNHLLDKHNNFLYYFFGSWILHQGFWFSPWA